tara:strand:- start:530 stop:748 length:219 start_codon:yes stop_codon:yes gene_type:complete
VAAAAQVLLVITLMQAAQAQGVLKLQQHTEAANQFLPLLLGQHIQLKLVQAAQAHLDTTLMESVGRYQNLEL